MTHPLFLLGTHRPGWLNHVEVPLFVSDTRLRTYQQLPTAVAPFALDSGGFSELQRHGTWTVPPRAYAARVRRYRDQIGHLTAKITTLCAVITELTHETKVGNIVAMPARRQP